jgi:tetrahydromethanopterin S-methyltransferase subunit G
MDATNTNNNDSQKGVYPAALRVTTPLFPSVAVIVTVLGYWVLKEEITKPTGVPDELWKVVPGDLAVLLGLVIGILVWFTVAYFYRPYTAAYYVSRRNYNGLRERLDSLKIRVKVAESNISQTASENENSAPEPARRQALARANKEYIEIENKLIPESRGMPWVSGLGYIELWHRVHRAEEALVKIEPCSEVLEGAMRDKSRLENANIATKESLLKQLDDAVDKIENPKTDKSSSVRSESWQRSANENTRVASEEHMDVRTTLSAVRYEINNFRDNTWEGLVHLRNSLADTVVLLGLATYTLLAFAVFLEAPPDTITWAVAYFLIGAIAGLFARAQGEWGSQTGVDDFGLSKTKLLQIPWLSGLAATRGVLITSILDPQTNSVDLAGVFSERPALLFIAAIFGVTPNLLIRKLDEQTDKTKEDLESTQSTQSTEDSLNSPGGQRRSFSARTTR